MWIAAKDGFYSVNYHEGFGTYAFRCRNVGDARRLCLLLGVGSDRIVELAGTDYQYRVLLDRREAMVAVMRLIDRVDYSNFKDEIARTGHQVHREVAYHGLWSALLRAETPGGGRFLGPWRHMEGL